MGARERGAPRASRGARRRAAQGGLILAALLEGCCTFSAEPHRGPPSDHFDGQRFYNPDPGYVDAGLGALVRWVWEREPAEWPEEIPFEAQPPPPARVDDLRVTFVNHATVLIQMDGINILTDPIWSERPSPVSFLGPRRVHAPGVRFEDLPRIDHVLISHSHYDHLDLPTLRRLFARDQPRVWIGLGGGAILRGGGVPKLTELDWWQSRPARGLKVTSVPVQHFANRGLCDRNGQLWTGWVLEGRAGRVYFAGDTGFGPHFEAARARLGPMRLAILPIGAFDPQWFMGSVHVDPAGAIRAHLALGAKTSVGMHFGTFRLSDEGPSEAQDTLAVERAKAGLSPEAFWVLTPGEGRDVPPFTSEEAPSGLASRPPSPRARPGCAARVSTP